MSTYQNLPGQLMEFKDGGLALRTEAVTVSTASVLILGTAIDGPKEPVAVSIDTVEALYGSDVDSNGIPNGSTIATRFGELYRAGCRDIRVQKISGETAKANISNVTRNELTVEKKNETLDTAEGNNQTTIVLSQDDIIANSIKIYANESLLSVTTQFTAGTSTLVIPAGVTDAGASLSFRYDYTVTDSESPVTQTSVIGADNKVTLQATPNTGSLTVHYNGVLVPDTGYTLSGVSVTFTSIAGVDTLPGTSVTLDYTTVVTQTLSATENGDANGQFRAATGTQTITLEAAPKTGTFHLYDDTGEVVAAAYSLTGVSLVIKKEYFKKDAILSASYFVEALKDVSETIKLESYFTSAVYNNGSIEVVDVKNSANTTIGKKVIINKPASKMVANEVALEYSSLDYPTFKQLVDVINRDLRNGVYKADTDYPTAATSNLQIGEFGFTGGDNGVNVSKEELFKNLAGERDEDGYLVKEGIFQLLENYSVDFVYLTGVYGDDELPGKFDDFAYELALFCAAVSHSNKTTYGCVDLTPCKNTTLQGKKDYVDKLCTYGINSGRFLLKDRSGKIYLNSEGKPQDIGQFIRVFAGPEPLYLSDTMGLHPAGNAAAYLGLQTTLAAQSSPMNKALPNSKGLRYALSRSQLDKLTGEGIITFTSKYDRNGTIKQEAYVTDSMTCALKTSDYVRTTTCEVVKVLCDDVREIGDPYIGEPPTTEKKNAFASALSKRFSQRKLEGVATDVSFEIVETATDLQLGDSKVLLSIVPPLERRRITTVVGLKPTK